jgi:hypothetical protein
LQTLVRHTLARTPRSPRCAPVVPQPRLGRNRRLRLTHALIASDLNPHYLDFWPLVRRAWSEIVELETVLVLVAEPNDVPRPLRDDPAVIVFPPLPDIHTAFQAQCIRLLYPGLLDVDGGVITSDADMAPLSRHYFHRPVARIDASHFVAYRDISLDNGEIPICYNAARPATWRRVFGVESMDDLRERLSEWAGSVRYAGRHGGEGWASDQQILYRTLVDHGRTHGAIWILNDSFTHFNRLERALVRKRGGGFLDEELRRLRRGGYSDLHCLVPHGDFRELNELAVDLAAGAAGGWSSTGRAGPQT